MKSLSRILSAAGLAVGLALTAVPADAQQKNAPAATTALKPGSPGAIAAAKEILTMKNASAMYANAVPNLVEQTKNVLMQSNLNYQKDLNEVAIIVAKSIVQVQQALRGGCTVEEVNEVTGIDPWFLDQIQLLNEVAEIVAKNLAGREKEIGDGMAQVYANEFTEPELQGLVTFYKSPLGQKLLATEPRAIQFSMSYMNQWAQAFAETINGQFRAEMKKRGKDI